MSRFINRSQEPNETQKAPLRPDMVDLVARALACADGFTCFLDRGSALQAAKVALEASHHAETVRTLQRCRRFFVSSWSAAEAEACLNELDALLAKIDGEA